MLGWPAQLAQSHASTLKDLMPLLTSLFPQWLIIQEKMSSTTFYWALIKISMRTQYSHRVVSSPMCQYSKSYRNRSHIHSITELPLHIPYRNYCWGNVNIRKVNVSYRKICFFLVEMVLQIDIISIYSSCSKEGYLWVLEKNVVNMQSI